MEEFHKNDVQENIKDVIICGLLFILPQILISLVFTFQIKIR